jgi:hypothetical protein
LDWPVRSRRANGAFGELFPQFNDGIEREALDWIAFNRPSLPIFAQAFR